MAARRPHNPIDAAAAEWVARLDRGLDGEETKVFEQWLDEDDRHRGAFIRARAAWTKLDRGIVLHPSSLTPRSGRPDRRQLLFGAGVAAAAAAAVVFTVEELGGQTVSHQTATGEISQVSLPDGSAVELDTDTRIVVSIRNSRRLVRLVRGRAWFKVAKDASRPFVVEAGSTRVRAVGTAFAVACDGRNSEVVVTEGVVDAWPAGKAGTARLRLERGAQARLTPDSAVRMAALSADDLEHVLAWRRGYISLQGETLAEAVAAFNRYNSRRIVVEDPSLAGRKLVGYFRIHEPDSFDAAASLSLSAVVETRGEDILLVPRPDMPTGPPAEGRG